MSIGNRNQQDVVLVKSGHLSESNGGDLAHPHNAAGSGVDVGGEGLSRNGSLAPFEPPANTEHPQLMVGSVDDVDTGVEASVAIARKASPGEFELLKVIGMGAFGKVLQVS